MSHLLQLNTSLFSHEGQSSRLADHFVAHWQARNPDDCITRRDLARDPLPHLDEERFLAFLAEPESRTPTQQAMVDESDTLIAELRAADVIVLGLPLYNFGIPSTLKAYFDHIARAGVTFRYTADGPEGLLTGKRAYVFAARGGRYAGTDADTQTGHVRSFFGLLGIDDLEFVYAEGLNLDEDSKQAALSGARETAKRLAA